MPKPTKWNISFLFPQGPFAMYLEIPMSYYLSGSDWNREKKVLKASLSISLNTVVY